MLHSFSASIEICIASSRVGAITCRCQLAPQAPSSRVGSSLSQGGIPYQKGEFTVAEQHAGVPRATLDCAMLLGTPSARSRLGGASWGRHLRAADWVVVTAGTRGPRTTQRGVTGAPSLEQPSPPVCPSAATMGRRNAHVFPDPVCVTRHRHLCLLSVLGRQGGRWAESQSKRERERRVQAPLLVQPERERRVIDVRAGRGRQR